MTPVEKVRQKVFRLVSGSSRPFCMVGEPLTVKTSAETSGHLRMDVGWGQAYAGIIGSLHRPSSDLMLTATVLSNARNSGA